MLFIPKMSLKEEYNVLSVLDVEKKDGSASESEILMAGEAVKNTTSKKWKGKKAVPAKKNKKLKAKVPAVWDVHAITAKAKNWQNIVELQARELEVKEISSFKKH